MDRDKWALEVLNRLPKNAISRAFGAISEIEFPSPIQGVVNRAFAEIAGIDTTEAVRRPEQYESLNAYFVRRLKQGMRTVESQDEQVLVSPVDGRIGTFGAIEEGMLFQAKGRNYRLLDLVDCAAEARRFDGGAYATIYLSPRDYHRIHCPVRGTVTKISYVPGYLFPVNPFAVANVDELFAVNERLISFLDTEELGRVALIKVGATCVGRISLSFDDIQTNCGLRRRREVELGEPVDFEHGDELAVFNLGSTVIVLVENGTFEFGSHVANGLSVKMGEILGRC